MHARDATALRVHVRESEQAARRLIARAAYMEKRAGRPGADPVERSDLIEIAQELRRAAQVLLTEISELSRQARAA
jgi:hypothetical protein